MPDTYSIKETARLSGLTPSVLRVWEFRYGWPSPRRARNGYRAFTKAQLDDLLRVAQLVKAGTPISQLIVDRFPAWPSELGTAHRPRRLEATKALPPVPSPAAGRLRADVVEALDRQHGGRVEELLQAAPVTVRPRDELHGVLVPVVVGVAELTAQGTPLAGAGRLLGLAAGRLAQLSRRGEVADALAIVADDEADLATARLVAALLTDQGQPARVVPRHGPIPAAAIQVGSAPGDGRTQRFSALGGPNASSIADLLRGQVRLASVRTEPARLAG